MAFFTTLHKTSFQSPHNSQQSIFVVSPQELSGPESNELDFFFKTLVQGGAIRVVVSMSRIQTIDSMGIGVLISSVKLIRKNGGEMVVTNVVEKIREIFAKIRMDNFVKILSTEEEGREALRRFIP